MTCICAGFSPPWLTIWSHWPIWPTFFVLLVLMVLTEFAEECCFVSCSWSSNSCLYQALNQNQWTWSQAATARYKSHTTDGIENGLFRYNFELQNLGNWHDEQTGIDYSLLRWALPFSRSGSQHRCFRNRFVFDFIINASCPHWYISSMKWKTHIRYFARLSTSLISLSSHDSITDACYTWIHTGILSSIPSDTFMDTFAEPQYPTAPSPGYQTPTSNRPWHGWCRCLRLFCAYPRISIQSIGCFTRIDAAARPGLISGISTMSSTIQSGRIPETAHAHDASSPICAGRYL